MRHLLEKLERKWRPFAPSNLTLYLIAGQGLFFALMGFGLVSFERIILIPSLLMEGQFWRILTFLFVPPSAALFFLILSWYIFFLMGTALEQSWGPSRYTLFLLIGYIITVVVSFITPNAYISNIYLFGSVFLAFALLHPNFELYLFFVLPVKMKWLGLLSFAAYVYDFVTKSGSVRLSILAAVCNLLLFFGSDALARLKGKKRRLKIEAQRKIERNKPFHQCVVCGITDQSHPYMDFRYCSNCEGDRCYCTEHIDSHKHIVAKQEEIHS